MIIPAFCSYSRISERMRCPWRHDQRYIEGVRQIEFERRPTLGAAIHKGVEAIIQGENDEEAVALFVEERVEKVFDVIGDGPEYEALSEEAESIVGEAIAISQRTADHIKLSTDWEILEYNKKPIVEMPFTVAIPGWLGFIGIIDLCARYKQDGTTWIIDWKSRKAIQDESDEGLNLQKAIYQYLLYRHGIETTGTMLIQIRQALPARPKLNKNGTMSRASITSDWETYKTELLNNNLDPADYEDMQSKFGDSRFWQVDRAHRTHREAQRVWDQIVIPAAAATRQAYLNNTTSPRNLGSFNCKGCWAKELCLTSLRGDATEHLFGTKYYIDNLKPGDSNDEFELPYTDRPATAEHAGPPVHADALR